MDEEAEAVLSLWFGDDLDSPGRVGARTQRWFSSDPVFDDLIRSQFGSYPDRALAGDFSHWSESARSRLAQVIILDQFPRNLYRNDPRSFAYDAAGLQITNDALAAGLDRDLHPIEAVFLYLPLEHAEDRSSQARSVSLFRALVNRAPPNLIEHFESFVGFAERHQAVIEQFGRFPHRNALLGRPSTPEEREYLGSGGETFSGSEDVS